MGNVMFCGKCGNACEVTGLGLECIDAEFGTQFNGVGKWECYDGFAHCPPFGRY